MVGRTVRIAKTQVSQRNGLFSEEHGKAVKMLVGMIQGQEMPFNDASVGIQQHPEASANHPATLVTAFLADLPLATSLSNGKQQLHRIAVHDRKSAGRAQKQVQPRLVRRQ